MLGWHLGTTSDLPAPEGVELRPQPAAGRVLASM